MKKILTQSEVQALINETRGRFFSVTFTKKDGTKRVVNGKNKYLRLLAGGGVCRPFQGGYNVAVNRNKESWFSALPEKITRFKCGEIDVRVD